MVYSIIEERCSIGIKDGTHNGKSYERIWTATGKIIGIADDIICLAGGMYDKFAYHFAYYAPVYSVSKNGLVENASKAGSLVADVQ